MEKILEGKKIAILATDGFEQSELFEPKKALEEAGAKVSIISLEKGEIKGWNENNWGESIMVDSLVSDVSSNDFDALQLPGGVMNPDKLRLNKDAIDFIKSFVKDEKPVAAICHAPWTLIEAEAVNGKKITSWKSLKKDLENAGAEWVDEEVVVDSGLITSRNPKDIPAFNKKMIEEFAVVRTDKQKSATQ